MEEETVPVKHARGVRGGDEGEIEYELVSLAIEERIAQIEERYEEGNVSPEDVRWLLEQTLELSYALGFYADPDSYFAIFIVPDRPAGAFADDFSNADHLAEYSAYDREMPGKRARRTLGLEATTD